ncbi:Lamin tail domain-containing protein 2 [Plecturocebus cupreus]
MDPKSGPAAEEAEEETLLSPTDRVLVSGHLGPPASTPAASATPTSLPDTTPHSSRVACSADPQSAPESLDPRTLRLLWGQRELEIQALRREVQNGWDARLCYILQEVAGLPPKRSEAQHPAQPKPTPSWLGLLASDPNRQVRSFPSSLPALTLHPDPELTRYSLNPSPAHVDGSSHSQERLLQSRVQKLTLQLKEQKERAQWALPEQEKQDLEERLLEATRRLQAVEAELQTCQKSRLPQLARASWVGRTLRSQTGSVEVVTAETLMDPSDLSENIQALTGEGFRLEDVDWNSIAHRYPNLFTNTELDSQQKTGCGVEGAITVWPCAGPGSWVPGANGLPAALPARLDGGTAGAGADIKQTVVHRQPWPWPQLDTGSPGSPGKYSEGHHADSDSSSCQRGLPYHLLKASGHSPQGQGASSEQALVQARSFRGGSEVPQALQAWSGLTGYLPLGTPFEGPPPQKCSSLDLQKTRSARHRKPVLAPEPCTDPDYPGPEPQQSPTGSCLKIAAVSARGKLVRILNQSQRDTAGLGGAVLEQLVRGRPERLYRFPPATLLAPRHHITVWGEAPRNAKKPPCASPGPEPEPSRSSRDCVTLLLGPKGEVGAGPRGRPGFGCGGDRRAPQVLSEHRIPHCATPAPRVLADDSDLSIDRFPLPEEGPGADPCEPPGSPRRGRLREPRVGRRRPRWEPRVPGPRPLSRPRPSKTAPRIPAPGRPRPPQVPRCRPDSPGRPSAPAPPQARSPLGPLFPGRPPPSRPSPSRTRARRPPTSSGKRVHPREGPAQHLPAIPGERAPEGERGPPDATQSPPPADAGLGLGDRRLLKEHRLRVCRKSVDRSCPMVALSVPNAAESRYGFRFPSCPPLTADACRRP